jgi:hypothetical protein
MDFNQEMDGVRVTTLGLTTNNMSEIKNARVVDVLFKHDLDMVLCLVQQSSEDIPHSQTLSRNIMTGSLLREPKMRLLYTISGHCGGTLVGACICTDPVLYCSEGKPATSHSNGPRRPPLTLFVNISLSRGGEVVE